MKYFAADLFPTKKGICPRMQTNAVIIKPKAQAKSLPAGKIKKRHLIYCMQREAPSGPDKINISCMSHQRRILIISLFFLYKGPFCINCS